MTFPSTQKTTNSWNWFHSSLSRSIIDPCPHRACADTCLDLVVSPVAIHPPHSSRSFADILNHLSTSRKLRSGATNLLHCRQKSVIHSHFIHSSSIRLHLRLLVDKSPNSLGPSQDASGMRREHAIVSVVCVVGDPAKKDEARQDMHA